ncbi:hypothetical protein FIV42_25355 [Persicimonas caeni]|uniref:Uncharacterized protein n=1 Tax=Persicimonas caeni TaxID=2292766 RepID=A0A4Y6Q034_PERCE|nr:hypothetical protein [Persicimonas caeni]QDG53948.1 hypothetical protein FIV42_25355 [Persicimonas caeni]QED35169.1 hypothetical protein FRD00_25350 [Persicimonas caeni]
MRKYLNPVTAVIIGVLVVLLAFATWTVFGTGEDGDSVQSEFFEEESPAERTGPMGGGPIDTPQGVVEPDESEQREVEVPPGAIDQEYPVLESADEPASEPADSPDER